MSVYHSIEYDCRIFLFHLYLLRFLKNSKLEPPICQVNDMLGDGEALVEIKLYLVIKVFKSKHVLDLSSHSVEVKLCLSSNQFFLLLLQGERLSSHTPYRYLSNRRLLTLVFLS